MTVKKKKKKEEEDGDVGKKEKVSHNNGLIPTYETNKKQTDQTENTTTQERK